jgi:putative SOS response-associated peptidase YedK
MCGRFFRHGVTWADYRAWLDLVPPDETDPPEATYNAAPGSYQPILRRSHSGKVELASALWGLVPSWWKKPMKEKTFTTFNAKSETVAEKPVFRGAFRHHRCLVPVSGYYEWTGRTGAKTPFAIGLRNRRHFCLAGLYDVALIDGSELHSFTVLTTTANDATAGVHHRMPVILHSADLELWLDGEPKEIPHLMRPFPAEGVHVWPVNPAVGNVRNNSAELIEEP